MWGDMWGWKYSGQDALEVKQNGAFTWPHLGKIDQLLLFLYVTPTVSSATLSLLFFEPISEMALPQNNWHSAFIIWGTCCWFDNKTIGRSERPSSHCPISLFVCDTNWQQLEALSSYNTHHASQIQPQKKRVSLFGCSCVILTSKERKQWFSCVCWWQIKGLKQLEVLKQWMCLLGSCRLYFIMNTKETHLKCRCVLAACTYSYTHTHPCTDTHMGVDIHNMWTKACSNPLKHTHTYLNTHPIPHLSFFSSSLSSCNWLNTSILRGKKTQRVHCLHLLIRASLFLSLPLCWS